MYKERIIYKSAITAVVGLLSSVALVNPAHADDTEDKVITKIVYVNVPGPTVYITKEVPVYITKTVIETQTVVETKTVTVALPPVHDIVNVENPLNTSLQNKFNKLNAKYNRLLKSYKVMRKYILTKKKKK